MSSEQKEVVFGGCSTEPLSNYLKSLGVFRLVVEQADCAAKGYWKNGLFVLKTSLGQEQLEAFFLEKYSPTPIISPWNNAAGFLKRNKTTGILDKILESEDPRLDVFSRTLESAREVVAAARNDGLALDKIGSKAGEDAKKELIVRLRNTLPDRAIRWVDAALVIRESDWKGFSLLGGGGNDGRAEFSVTFIEQIEKTILSQKNEDNRKNLSNALFGTESNGFKDSLFGQFNPSAAGNFNASNDYTSKSHTNPWDYVLTLEGALVFAGAAVRRYKDTQVDPVAAFPFSVRHLGSGYGTAAKGEKPGSEMWFPTWRTPASLAEVEFLFSEGRADFGSRRAENALEFAQSTVSLGIDRGLTEFHRYAFIERNGQARFAVKLDAFEVHERQDATLLQKPIGWIGKGRKGKNSEGKEKSLREIEESLFRLCHLGFDHKETVQETIISFGRFLQEAAKREDCRELVQPLLDAEWLGKANDESNEFRLAASLASLLHADGIRLERTHGNQWKKDFNGWLRRPVDPVRLLNGMMADRVLRLSQERHGPFREETKCFARLEDVNAFLEGRLDEQKIVALTFGLLFLKWNDVERENMARKERFFPGAGYGLAKLCYSGVPLGGNDIPLVPAIHKKMASGNGKQALGLVVRRLRASGYRIPDYRGLEVPKKTCERIAAALLFPLRREDVAFIKRRILDVGGMDDEF